MAKLVDLAALGMNGLKSDGDVWILAEMCVC